MPIVPAKCTQCGAALKVDDSLEAAICEYCKMPFIVEKAINIYQGVGATDDSLVENGYAMINIDRRRAETSFNEALKINPNPSV